MKKVFLATSFSHQVDEQGFVLPVYRQFLEGVLTGLRKLPDTEVFCALEHDEWKMAEELPEASVQKDLEEIDAADVVVVLVHDKPSAGAEFEFGYAVGKGKKTVIVRKESEDLMYFNQGVVSAGHASLITYDTPEALVSNLVLAINAPE